MESAENSEQRRRMPLAEVVTNCVTRWFQYTLKEAKAGDIAMQVLVGQMYYSGYGVPRDAQKGRTWIGRAAERNGLQCGKLAISIQVIMRVTRILIIPRKMSSRSRCSFWVERR